jgi:hypothetical protein
MTGFHTAFYTASFLETGTSSFGRICMRIQQCDDSCPEILPNRDHNLSLGVCLDVARLSFPRLFGYVFSSPNDPSSVQDEIRSSIDAIDAVQIIAHKKFA